MKTFLQFVVLILTMANTAATTDLTAKSWASTMATASRAKNYVADCSLQNGGKSPVPFTTGLNQKEN